MNEVKSVEVQLFSLEGAGTIKVQGEFLVQRVAELIKAESSGRAFVMPAAIGETVWFFDPEDGPEPFECRVKGYYYSSGCSMWFVELQFVIKGISANSVEVPVDELGICWFLDEADDVRTAHSDEWRKDIHKAYLNGLKAGCHRLASRIADRIETEFAACGKKKQAAAARIVDIITEIYQEEVGTE